ncbi:MAG: hypothetical protein CMG63_00825 [Candidatus Marinimicrobia bacterium]|nr:hypothetical protein [Candidatus Neomarinimicrobiota bacterium]
MEIRQILDKIDDNQLFVPAFQREYVWKRANVRSLFSSLVKDYPTGSLLIWETNKPPELKGTVYEKTWGAVKLILDGQQRITSLYLIIKGKNPPYYQEKEITQNIQGLHVNLENLKLEYIAKAKKEKDPYWVDLTEIFNRTIRPRDIYEQFRRIDKELTRDQEYNLDDNFNKVFNIMNVDFKEQTIPVSASIKDAIDIFYTVNSQGIRLTQAELALAQISGYWADARKVLKAKQYEMRDNGINLSLDFFVYCLLGVLHNTGSEMAKLHNEDNKNDLIYAWEKLAKQTLDYTFNILKSQAYVDSVKEIKSIYGLIPLIVYVYNKGCKLNEIQIKKITQWFYYSQLKGRYSRGQTNLDKDINIILNSKTPFDELLSVLEGDGGLDISPNFFRSTTISHPLFSILRWYFKSRNAVCLNTGVQLRKNLGSEYSLELDHIFPLSVMREKGYSQDDRYKYSLVQEVTNRAILTKIENRNKGAEFPKNYLERVQKNHPKAMNLQCIPEDPSLWELDMFEEFLENRRNILSKKINEWLRNITKIQQVLSKPTPYEIIAEGESGNVEFKSTLRFDMDKHIFNKELEFASLKTIAAFNNSSGGILFIGVDNEGTILGLENDYALMGVDKDGFELHLYNLMNANFGINYTKSYGNRNISVSFPKIGDQEICMVEVKSGDKHLVLEHSNKNGIKTEKLFIRTGNQTVQIEKLDEKLIYLNDRFNLKKEK